ncbi:hypothetical protein ACHAWO_013588 [Cyclotella atomus]|uniref:Calpain catalytic domain-containing protein n=1 Tax=Cyclotella atomus TaxID=382360 RepID=A0ABD3PDU5_9STRA
MTKPQRKGEELLRLLSVNSKQVELTPHDLVSTPSSRREGQIHSSGTSPSINTADAISSVERALNDHPHDMYLGLKWYRSDPLPSLVCAFEEMAKKSTSSFVDDEFPVHDGVHLEVLSKPSDQEVIKCIPGVITSSNCRDFITVPKRIPRIQHFVNKAKIDGGGWSWKRASLMHNGTCALFSASSSKQQSIDPRNILQGKVGNCGFCSGIASVAGGFPTIIENAFGPHSQLTLSTIGAVSILMYPRGQPRYLLMDDFILCKNDKDQVAYNGRNPPSPSMHSLLPTDVWVRLLEKAFVKVQGSYASLDGYYKYNSLYRHPARAIQLLTGARLALEVHYSIDDVNIMYKILSSSQGRYAKVVHCRKRFEGLIPNHGYSLLWVGEGGGEHWVCLRNPHGKTSYKGHGWDGALICNGKEGGSLPSCLNVCDNTKRVVWKQSNSECHAAFSLRDCHHDNGIFFMQFKTFIECFPITTLVGPMDSAAKEVNGCSDVFVLDSSKECVHEVHRSNLTQLYEIIADVD